MAEYNYKEFVSVIKDLYPDEMNAIGADEYTDYELASVMRDLYPKELEAMGGVKFPSIGESLGRGALQGATFNFSDEITGAALSFAETANKIMKDIPGITMDQAKKFAGYLYGKGIPTKPKSLRDISKSSVDAYRRNRDKSREEYTAAHEENPKTFVAGELGGGLATLAVPGVGPLMEGKNLASATRAGLTFGSMAGLGASEADITKGDIGGAAFDTGISAGLGGGFGALGFKASPLLKKLWRSIVIEEITGPAGTFKIGEHEFPQWGPTIKKIKEKPGLIRWIGKHIAPNKSSTPDELLQTLQKRPDLAKFLESSSLVNMPLEERMAFNKNLIKTIGEFTEGYPVTPEELSNFMTKVEQVKSAFKQDPRLMMDRLNSLFKDPKITTQENLHTIEAVHQLMNEAPEAYASPIVEYLANIDMYKGIIGGTIGVLGLGALANFGEFENIIDSLFEKSNITAEEKARLREVKKQFLNRMKYPLMVGGLIAAIPIAARSSGAVLAGAKKIASDPKIQSGLASFGNLLDKGVEKAGEFAQHGAVVGALPTITTAGVKGEYAQKKREKASQLGNKVIEKASSLINYLKDLVKKDPKKAIIQADVIKNKNPELSEEIDNVLLSSSESKVVRAAKKNGITYYDDGKE